jgi:hypothetical protein
MGPAVLWAVTGGLTAALLVYSQTVALEGDEAFHLLASFLVSLGKRPYVDFFHQHPPLYLYANAAWMWWLGPGWRGAHLISVLCTGGTAFLLGDYVWTRLQDWR